MQEFNGWIYIPEYIGDAINDICTANFGKVAGDPCQSCPLRETCEGFANDLRKSDAENTRNFEAAMADAYKNL